MMTIDELAHSLDLETGDCIELLRLFFDVTDGDLGRMRSALARGDAPAFERAAHSIKGASLGLGLAEISDAALRGEVRARELRLEELPFLLDEIRKKAASAAEAFSSAISGSRSREEAERKPGREATREDFQEESHP